MYQRFLLVLCGLYVIVSSVLLAQTFTPLTGTPGPAYIAGNSFGFQTMNLIRENFNALVLPQYWTGAASTTLSAEKNLGALSTGLVINTAGVPSAYAGSTCGADTTTTSISASGVVTCGITPATTTSTTIFTNKTLDAEGTGNVLSVPFTQWIQAAICTNVTASSPEWSFPTADPGVPACQTGTNTQYGTLDFADGANALSAQTHVRLPNDFTGTVTAKFVWFTSATSGNVFWQLATICVADAETSDPAFNTASTVADTAKGTTLQLNDASIASVTITGCVAGETMFVKLTRDPANGSDTLAATARLVGVEITTRRAM